MPQTLSLECLKSRLASNENRPVENGVRVNLSSVHFAQEIAPQSRPPVVDGDAAGGGGARVDTGSKVGSRGCLKQVSVSREVSSAARHGELLAVAGREVLSALDLSAGRGRGLESGGSGG